MGGNVPAPLSANSLPSVKWVKRSSRTYYDDELSAHLSRCVYRYCTIAEALALLLRGEWSFITPAEWEDSYEGHLSTALFGEHGPFRNSATYLKCVSFEYYNHAIWRTYGSPGGLVRLGFTLDKLIDCLDACVEPRNGEVYIGRVRYVQPKVLRQEIRGLVENAPESTTSRQMPAILMKRWGFRFENEIRIAYFLPVAAKEAKVEGEVAKNTASLITAKGFPREFVDQLLVDPYLKDWQGKELVRLFAEILKVPKRVNRSQFNATPRQLKTSTG